MQNIYKKNINKLFIPIVGIAILTGCSMLDSKNTETKAPISTTNQTIEIKTSTDSNPETVLTLYIYGDDDYENPKEKKVFSIKKEKYEKNLTEVLNDIFKETRIKFNSVTIDQNNNCIIADIPEAVANDFDSGSCMGTILTNELIMTLLNLPDVQKAIVTVNGEEGLYGNHYNFDGIFVKDGETRFKMIVEKE